jgi:hypothetical protein
MVDFVMQIAGLGILIVWYFGHAKPQIKYVKETFGKDYGRKPWGLPLLLGFSAIVLYFLTCICLAAVFLVQNPADIAVALEFDVKNSMVQEFQSNPQFQGVSIRSVSLQHDEGDSYRGFAELTEQGKTEKYPLVVKFDGKTINWQLQPQKD